MKTSLLLILSILIFNSCASILNSPTQHLSIVTSEPSKLSILNDSSANFDLKHDVTVNRSKDSLHIKVFNDTTEKIVIVKSTNSFAYWLNLYPSILWTGFLIDKNEPCRYAYPRTIFIDISNSQNDYLKFVPFDSVVSKYNNLLKVNPWKAFDISNSGFQISLERKFNSRIATQLSATYLFPQNLVDLLSEFKSHIKGFQIALEEKWYYRESAPFGPYISLEFSYLRNRYRDFSYFSEKNIFSDTSNNFTNYIDEFGIKKQTYSLNFKVGYQIYKKRICVDFYSGIGIRYKDVIHLDRINQFDEMVMQELYNLNYITNLNGKYWTISIPFSFRIGWTF